MNVGVEKTGENEANGNGNNIKWTKNEANGGMQMFTLIYNLELDRTCDVKERIIIPYVDLEVEERMKILKVKQNYYLKVIRLNMKYKCC